MSPYAVLRATRLLRRVQLLHVEDVCFRKWTLPGRQVCWHLELLRLPLWLTIQGLSHNFVSDLQRYPHAVSMDQALLASCRLGIRRTVSVTLTRSRPWWATSASSWT